MQGMNRLQEATHQQLSELKSKLSFLEGVIGKISLTNQLASPSVRTSTTMAENNSYNAHYASIERPTYESTADEVEEALKRTLAKARSSSQKGKH